VREETRKFSEHSGFRGALIRCSLGWC
jgi:hypothetical protein